MFATGDDTDKRSMQGTSIFCVSMFQYLTLAIIYSKGHPYRKSLFSNKPLRFSLVILFITSTFITINPPQVLINFFEFDTIPYFEYRLFLFFVGCLSGVISYLFEIFIIQHLILDIMEG